MRWTAVVAAVGVALALVARPGAAPQPPISGWLSFGNGPARAGATSASLDPRSLRPAWFRETDGMVTTQPLVARNVPERGQTTAFVATTLGRVIAYASNGFVRWQHTLGAAPNSCPQLDAYGVLGTPVVDPRTRALYVADGFGLLHALDLVTGRERAGWPVRLFDDPTAEIVWGALTLVDGSVYVGTGSYCDRPMEGKLLRVEIASRRVSSWTAVPKSLGGGGSVWGWGGVSYSAARNALFVVTGNALSPDESAGYGEQLVELAPDLHVLAASHPPEVSGSDDFDFVGSPVLFTPAGCGEVAAGADKNGRLFFWHTASVEKGAFASVAVQPVSVAEPLLTQPAYDATTRSIYMSTFSSLVRVTVNAGCTDATVTWSKRFPNVTLQGSPTVAGSIVWVALSGAPGRLRGYDAVTGALRFDRKLGGVSFAPPSIVAGRMYEDARHGLADRTATGTIKASARARAYTSHADRLHTWQSRGNGVYSTDDGGRSWHRIYPTYAQRVLRLDAKRGVISVGAGTVSCDCRERQLWTSDGGATWHETRALGAYFAGRGSALFSWSGSALRQAAWPPVRSSALRTLPQTIADAAVVPGGVAALLTAVGRDWDNSARIVFIRRGTTTTVQLPSAPGRVLARALTVEWPTVTVRTYMFGDSGRHTILWRSTNGGETWSRAA